MTYSLWMSTAVGFHRNSMLRTVLLALLCDVMFAIEVTVNEGRSATLPCSVGFSGDYTVEWRGLHNQLLYRKNRKLTSDARLRLEKHTPRHWDLVIGAVTRQDAGQYKCIIKTDKRQYKTITLRVRTAPSITQAPPPEIHVLEGRDVTMRCSAAGDPPPQVTWFRTISQKPRLSVARGETLELRNVTEGISGLYECEADNDVPPAARAKVTLQVQSTRCDCGPAKAWPKVDLTKPAVSAVSPVPGVLGSAAVLQCVVTGHPVTSAHWTKDNRNVSHPAGIWRAGALRYISSLYIAKVTSGDLGRYRCDVTNSKGVDSAVVVLTSDAAAAVSAPRLVAPPADVVVTLHGTAVLRCTVEGLAPPHTLTWWRHGPLGVHPVYSTDPSSQTGYRHLEKYQVRRQYNLQVAQVQQDDSGQYTCDVTGLGNFSATLTVLEQPTCEHASNQTAREGEPLSLTCHSAYSGPDPRVSVTWTRGSTVYSSAVETAAGRVTSSLRIYPQQTASGRFMCTVSDGRSLQATCAITVTVLPASGSHGNHDGHGAPGGYRHVDMFTFYVSVSITAGALILLFGSALCAVSCRYRRQLRRLEAAAARGEDIVVLNYRRGRQREARSNKRAHPRNSVSNSLARQESVTNERAALTPHTEADV